MKEKNLLNTTRQYTVMVHFFVVLSIGIGCTGDTPPLFESPDSIRVTTWETIQGKVEHLMEFQGSDGTSGVTIRAVLAVKEADVTDATFYVVITYTSSTGRTKIDSIIRSLSQATDITDLQDIPEGVVPVYTVQVGGENPQISFYLWVQTVNLTRFHTWYI